MHARDLDLFVVAKSACKNNKHCVYWLQQFMTKKEESRWSKILNIKSVVQENDGRVVASPKVHHLHCFSFVQLKIVTFAPVGHLVDHPSVSRLITNESNHDGVVCKLCGFYRGVHGGVVICVQGEEQR